MAILTTLFGLGNQELLLISIAILFYSVVIWTVVDLFSNKDLPAIPKLLWLIVILFFPFLGTLIYLYYGRSAKHLSNQRQ
ncbi:PLD nuclease N-terminal domain-containing protein [Dyadobacter luticola]|uniref:PLDc_N domain-containing protein n=1 Tax=Dyadobacter luticola TaxID=1979387 RepID=A0A5R9L2U8_9BACT|nr:PLDc_N domain-containing protein [Dyadobacter luticola]